MYLAIDFDGTVVSQKRPYTDLKTPLKLLPGAKAALQSLKKAGHVLLLYSARANRALLEDPQLDPLVRAGVRKVNLVQWKKEQPLHKARYAEMVEFVRKELPNVFASVDDGMQGKPEVDLFLDDRALGFGPDKQFHNWKEVAHLYGA